MRSVQESPKQNNVNALIQLSSDTFSTLVSLRCNWLALSFGPPYIFLMLRLWFLLQLILASCLSLAVAVYTPPAGWCRSSHHPKKPAQSGLDNYCKACYKEKCPQKHAQKIANRLKNSSFAIISENLHSEAFASHVTGLVVAVFAAR